MSTTGKELPLIPDSHALEQDFSRIKLINDEIDRPSGDADSETPPQPRATILEYFEKHMDYDDGSADFMDEAMDGVSDMSTLVAAITPNSKQQLSASNNRSAKKPSMLLRDISRAPGDVLGNTIDSPTRPVVLFADDTIPAPLSQTIPDGLGSRKSSLSSVAESKRSADFFMSSRSRQTSIDLTQSGSPSSSVSKTPPSLSRHPSVDQLQQHQNQIRTDRKPSIDHKRLMTGPTTTAPTRKSPTSQQSSLEFVPMQLVSEAFQRRSKKPITPPTTVALLSNSTLTRSPEFHMTLASLSKSTSTLQQALLSPSVTSYFLLFLLHNHSAENLLFYLDLVNEYEVEIYSTLSAQKQVAMRICSTYVSEGSPMELNLDHKTRKNVLEMIRLAFDRKMNTNGSPAGSRQSSPSSSPRLHHHPNNITTRICFDPAKAHVYSLLEQSWRQFVSSSIIWADAKRDLERESSLVQPSLQARRRVYELIMRKVDAVSAAMAMGGDQEQQHQHQTHHQSGTTLKSTVTRILKRDFPLPKQ